MLTHLRKKKIAKRILWGLAIIIIPAFILWGAGSISKDRTGNKYVGEIEGKKITFKRFGEAIMSVRLGLFLNYYNQPQALDKLQKDEGLLARLAWENLIIKSKATKQNIKVSDREVVNFVTNHPMFVRDGRFDKKLYDYILKNAMGITPRSFEEKIRDFLIIAKCKNDIIEDVTVTDEEVLSSYKKEFEKAKVSYILVEKKDFEEGLQVSDEEISAYYEKNKDFFREPEKIVVQYIAFPHRKPQKKEDVLDRLRTAYEKIKRQPKNMEKIAGELGLTIKSTPPFARNEIMPDIGNIGGLNVSLFQLKPLSDVYPLITESEGATSYIFRVKKKIPSRLQERDEVAPYIVNILKRQKAVEFAKDRAERIYEEAVSQSLSLEALAKVNELTVETTDLVSRFDYIEGVGEAYEIVDKAFEAGKGAMSGPIEVRKGFVIMQPVEIKKIDKEKFEEEKEEYRNKVLSVKKMKALQDWLNEARTESTLYVDPDTLK